MILKEIKMSIYSYTFLLSIIWKNNGNILVKLKKNPIRASQGHKIQRSYNERKYVKIF